MIQSKNYLYLFFIVLSFCLSKGSIALAQGFSYVYIQGDKKTPIYTKVEGVMMPRYGKNYALLSRLAPGPLNIEILFQQNEYPAVQFNILVPENGKRAFVLQKKEEGFALYDVQQNFYLKANNSIEDDHLPTILSNANIAGEKYNEPKTVVTSEKTEEVSAFNKAEKPKAEMPEPIKTEATEVGNTSTTIDSATKPKFIENITFDNSTNTPDTKEGNINVGEQTNKENRKDNTIPIILNSDCKNQITTIQYLKLINNITAKKSENERLGLIIESTKQNCFSTEQAEKLIEKLDSDIAKYSALKNIYPKITDQANFGSLVSLLQEEEWKSYFVDLTQAK